MLQVLVTPLHPAHDLAKSWQMPLVLVIVSDTHQMAETAAGRMRRMYGLTPAEARLVGEVADGRTLAEIAEQRAVSISTLRSQLVAAFDKTGVRRQVDLVRLVTALTQVADGNE
jgi:DNA-binding CsgD family transcriptional regulator